MPTLIAVSGPAGSGKTTWISQFFQAAPDSPQFYLSPGLGDISVDLARIGYRFPLVQVVPENQIQIALTALPETATVYIELGFHLDLNSPFFAALPCRRVAVVPPDLTQSIWHDWADEVIPGNPALPETNWPAALLEKPPQLWRSALMGQVFDPPSLDAIWAELTGGAYGAVQRAKGIFEMPDGRAFYIDFVAGLPGSEYVELQIPRWLSGRPQRYSGIEVTGWNLETAAIAQTILDGCLTEEAIAQYQAQIQAADPDFGLGAESDLDPTYA